MLKIANVELAFRVLNFDSSGGLCKWENLENLFIIASNSLKAEHDSESRNSCNAYLEIDFHALIRNYLF